MTWHFVIAVLGPMAALMDQAAADARLAGWMEWCISSLEQKKGMMIFEQNLAIPAIVYSWDGATEVACCWGHSPVMLCYAMHCYSLGRVKEWL